MPESPPDDRVLPGLIASALGAVTTQTDRQEVALSVCRRNAERNGLRSITHTRVEWEDCDLGAKFDWIIGSDIAYASSTHAALQRLFDSHLSDGGRVLLSDPFRAASMPLLHALEEDGWSVELSKWMVDVNGESRAVGVYELAHSERTAI